MKRQVLEELKRNKGIFISGEELSNKIGVSRTAVWKHIKGLKEEGYQIESISRKGYSLIKEADILDKDAIEIELGKSLLDFKIFHHDTIDSTNNLAKKMASEGALEGTVVIAEKQTGGRGRLGREWVSPSKKGIWMSLILRPKIEPKDATKITQITAAAVTLAIQKRINAEVGIKWPNDIIINKKKVCGILTEMGAELSFVNYIVVGIGINVNIDQEEFSEELAKIATSIKECVGEEISRKKLVIEILNIFEELYLDFIKTKNINRSLDICKTYSVTLGKKVKVKSRNTEIFAEALDITEDGELLIKTEDGELQKVFSGEVSVRGIFDYI